MSRAADGRYYDTDPATPGTQPRPAKAAAVKGPLPGRLVNQLVKVGADLQHWRAALASVDGSTLRGPQRQRMAEALADLKGRVAQLEAEPAAGQGEVGRGRARGGLARIACRTALGRPGSAASH